GCCCEGGVACRVGGATCRWAPRLRPPPSLAACASSAMAHTPSTAAIKVMMNAFMTLSSKLVATVQRDDARCEVEIFDAVQARPLEHRLQALLVRVHADRLGEIAIGRFVARYLPAEPGQHAERVPVVYLRERRPHARELEHQQPPGGPQDAPHLTEG